jgi:aminoglycoside 3-N-acetyltransferase
MVSDPGTAARLADDLRALGLGAGSRIVVHSSLRSIGPPSVAPDDVLDALLAAVGGAGLVVAPTFTYTTSRFDPLTTPGRTGALAEALRARPGAVRSHHPFHSLAALGDGAEPLLAGHEDEPGTSVGSPLGRLADEGGLVLLLGVSHVTDTTIHVGEFAAVAPYLDIAFDPEWPRAAEIELPEGGTRRVEYDRFPGCSRAFGAVEQVLRRHGSVADGTVGRAVTQLVPGQEVVRATVELLADDPAALLCTDARCYRCTRARERLTTDARAPGAEAGRAR